VTITLFLLKIKLFWDVTPRRDLKYPEKGGSWFLKNISNSLSINTATLHAKIL
jgi:hypothetical protein